MDAPERRFGPYLILIDGDHAVVTREDGHPPEPGWYEMQHMKSMAFGGDTAAVEVFPRQADLVDGQNQRHLWRVEAESVPNLRNGQNIASAGET
jgi:hypothetical protein